MQRKTSYENNTIKFIYLTQLLITFVCAFLGLVSTERVQDLVLTPKQGLQLHGKSIFYEDNSKAYLRNESIRPWERTLKHVTFLTLFPDVEESKSKLQLYNNFLQSPYVIQHSKKYVRFGDIVLLAAGWLEGQKEGTTIKYRFIEGQCDQNCLHNSKEVVALWQVQKIRHRDGGNRKFSYEMKFSISALKNNLNDQNSDKFNKGYNNLQRNYIQREDDYPQSFGRIIHPADEEFAERFTKSTDVKPPTSRSKQLKPEATFLESFLLPPPPTYRQQLNIGEYVRDSTERGISKIELFPNVFNTHFPQKQEHVFDAPTVKLNDTLPVVMHHYHHHFYMPNSVSLENELTSAEHLSLAEADLDRIHLNTPRLLPPVPQKILTPATTYDQLTGEIEPQKIVHVASMHQFHNQPLPFFPIKLNQQQILLRPQTKPFIQSDKLDEPVYYSEPDPLYPPELVTLETDRSQLDEHIEKIPVHNAENVTIVVETSSITSNDLSTTTTETPTTSYSTTLKSSPLLKPYIKTTRSPNFVSTSTTQHAVRAASRYRKGYRSSSTTTTERPVKKFRSKFSNDSSKSDTTIVTTSQPDSKVNNKHSQKHKRFERILPTTTPVLSSTLPTTEHIVTTTGNEITTEAPVLTSGKNEIYEILTKKSVSKSVSIKVGKNGEELPIIDAVQNEVKID